MRATLSLSLNNRDARYAYFSEQRASTATLKLPPSFLKMQKNKNMLFEIIHFTEGNKTWLCPLRVLDFYTEH